MTRIAMTETKGRLLDAAAKAIQTRGYNGFSFHDLSTAVGIKTASIHYHFPTKAALGEALVQRYSDDFMKALGDPDAEAPDELLARYIGLFRQSLQQGRMCLCGMVGAEIEDVPEAVAAEVRAFFAANRLWLQRVLTRQGVPKPFETAAMVIAALEGAMLVARVSGDSQLFDVIADSVARRSADA
jgi:TetR/AcrR family transcriptional regulator, transcriptional repressor for nem operon